MSVIVVGTMAFDAIETPFGKSEKIIGGSATREEQLLSRERSPDLLRRNSGVTRRRAYASLQHRESPNDPAGIATAVAGGIGGLHNGIAILAQFVRPPSGSSSA